MTDSKLSLERGRELAKNRQVALIVGLNNPLSSSPEDALVPWPDGCTGARLYDLIRESAPKVTEDHYLAAFDRMNLWPGPEIPKGVGRAKMLRAQGRKVLNEIFARGYRTVVLLGPLVWTNVLETTETPEWFTSRSHYGRQFYYVPHPSGRNLLYNNPMVRKRASSLLAQLALEALAA